MRLIDADALLTHECEADRMGAMLVVGKGYILSAPAVDPVTHAKWLDFIGDWSTAECSQCGEIYEVSPYEDEEHFDAFKQTYLFCPRCGAKMDETEDKL